MPKTNSTLLICPYPIISDVYEGCTHGCKYCFANARLAKDVRSGFQCVRTGDSFKQIEDYVNGKRTKRESWVDWDIPIRFGANSDPFQPCELQEKRMMAVLKLLARKGYPFVVTTKGASVISRHEYLSVLHDCNVCVNLSMSSPAMEPMEPGVPTFAERLIALEKLAATVPRVIARMQPFFIEHTRIIAKHIPQVAKTGCWGIILEALDPSKNRVSNLQVKAGNRWTYAYTDLRKAYTSLKSVAHKHGLSCITRGAWKMSDAPTLCCTGEMPGFVPNKCNLLYYYYKPEEYAATARMNEIGTGDVFNVIGGDRLKLGHRKDYSFKQLVDYYAGEEKWRQFVLQ